MLSQTLFLAATIASIVGISFWCIYFWALRGEPYFVGITRWMDEQNKLPVEETWTVLERAHVAVSLIGMMLVEFSSASLLFVPLVCGATLDLDIGFEPDAVDRITRRRQIFSLWPRLLAWLLPGGIAVGLVIWALTTWLWEPLLWITVVILPLLATPLFAVRSEAQEGARNQIEEDARHDELARLESLATGAGLSELIVSRFSDVREAALAKACQLGDAEAVAAIDARLAHWLARPKDPHVFDRERHREFNAAIGALGKIGSPPALDALRRHYQPAGWRDDEQAKLAVALHQLGDPPRREAIESALAAQAGEDWLNAAYHLNALDALHEAASHPRFIEKVGKHVGELLDTAGHALNRQHHFASEQERYQQATSSLDMLNDAIFAHGLIACIRQRTPASQPNAKGAYLKGGTRIHLVWDNNYAWDRFADLVSVIERRTEQITSEKVIAILRAAFEKPDFPLTTALLAKCKTDKAAVLARAQKLLDSFKSAT